MPITSWSENMKRLFLSSLFLGLLAGSSWGQEREGAPKPEPLQTKPAEKPAPAPSPCGCGFCQRMLHEHQILVVPKECATTLPRVEIRKEETPGKECALEVFWETKEQKVVELVTKAKDVEKTVMCTRM